MPKITKKVIIFLVEGPSDREALAPVLKKLFVSDQIHFHVMHGDITSHSMLSSDKSSNILLKYIDTERKKYGFKPKDILKVVQIIDTDGAFIADESVIYGENTRIEYKKNCIITKYPEQIQARNQRKTASVKKLIETNYIGTAPYFIYYLSRNLEHVLMNIAKDVADDKKTDYADSFADRFKNKPLKFLNFISSIDFAVTGDYNETWDFIMQGNNSLKRHSNLHLLFENL